jgi:hypothetical protein
LTRKIRQVIKFLFFFRHRADVGTRKARSPAYSPRAPNSDSM